MYRPQMKAMSVLVACTLFGLIVGYAFGKDYVEPPQWARDMRDEVGGWFTSTDSQIDSEAREKVGSVRLESIFVPLMGDWVAVPTDRSGAGGGLTSFGPDVLVLTFEGRVFAASSPATLRETSIGVPDNGFGALAGAVRDQQYEGYEFDLSYVRYNDILHFRSDDLHGLAISFTDWRAGDECYRTSIAVLPLPPSAESIDEISATSDDWQPLFSTEPCLPLKKGGRAIEGHMAGGRIAYSPPETLYLGSGDYHWDGMHSTRVLAQDPDNQYGKVIAINLRSGEHRIVSRGHRNTQGIVVDSDGEVWVVEQGPRGGDELNRVEGGRKLRLAEGVLRNPVYQVSGSRSHGADWTTRWFRTPRLRMAPFRRPIEPHSHHRLSRSMEWRSAGRDTQEPLSLSAPHRRGACPVCRGDPSWPANPPCSRAHSGTPGPVDRLWTVDVSRARTTHVPDEPAR